MMAKEKYTQDNVAFQSIHSLFKSRLNTGIVVNLKNIDPISFLHNSKDSVLNFIRDIRSVHHCLKFNLTFFGNFELQESNEEKQFTVKYKEIYKTSNLENWYDKAKNEILSSMDDFQFQQKSAWTFKESKCIVISIVKHNPRSVGSYKDIPDWVSKTGDIINIQTMESDCFEFCLLAALEYPRETKNLQYTFKYTELKAEKYSYSDESNCQI